MNFIFKNYHNFFLSFILISLIGCQLQEPLKTHGIVYLENRANKLTSKVSNKNDVIQLIGRPHIKDESYEDTWIYLERILSKGKYHKLGKHVLKANNVLVLKFDKYGILNEKIFLNKGDINKIKFSKKNTDNEISQKSFVQTFLQSIKQKMYGRRK